MNDEVSIREALEKRRAAGSIWIPQQADMNHDVSPQAANDYVIAWVEKIVFGEHQVDSGYYCTAHRRFYWQPMLFGKQGLGCPECHNSQVPSKDD